MVSFKNQHGWFLTPKLKRLQDLQTEIYRQLQLLIPDQVALYDSFQSQVSGSPLLRMDILERHPYTHFLRLTYQFKKGEQREVAPDAHIRLYNDARLAEVTSFNPEQGFDRQPHGAKALQGVSSAPSAAPASFQNHPDARRPPPSASYPTEQILERSWRQNRALDKWLAYLLHQGHNLTSMKPAGNKISGKPAIPVKAAASSH